MSDSMQTDRVERRQSQQETKWEVHQKIMGHLRQETQMQQTLVDVRVQKS